MTEANTLRDKRIRRRILRTLDGAKVSDGGGLGGRTLLDIVESVSPRTERLESDEHLIGLCRDLVGASLIQETDERAKKSQRMSLDFLYYRITVSGTAVIEQLVPAHPLVEDDRR